MPNSLFVILNFLKGCKFLCHRFLGLNFLEMKFAAEFIFFKLNKKIKIQI